MHTIYIQCACSWTFVPMQAASGCIDSAVASATVWVLLNMNCTEWMPFGLILIKWKLHSRFSFNIDKRMEHLPTDRPTNVQRKRQKMTLSSYSWAISRVDVFVCVFGLTISKLIYVWWTRNDSSLYILNFWLMCSPFFLSLSLPYSHSKSFFCN